FERNSALIRLRSLAGVTSTSAVLSVTSTTPRDRDALETSFAQKLAPSNRFEPCRLHAYRAGYQLTALGVGGYGADNRLRCVRGTRALTRAQQTDCLE